MTGKMPLRKRKLLTLTILVAIALGLFITVVYRIYHYGVGAL